MSKQNFLGRNLPCVVFFKLKSPCSACDSFMPVWQRLTADPAFQGKVGFVVYSFGQDPSTGQTFKVSPEYTQIVEGHGTVPIFVIHLPNGDLIDLANGPPNRTFDTMKQTIINALSTTGYYK